MAVFQDLLSKYMRDNYFTRQGIDEDSTMINIASCRLLLDIMPGLEISTMQEQEGLGTQLYRWIEEADEPLKSYAIGILAVIMDYHEFASDTEIRDRNSKLVPVMLNQLKQLQQESEEERRNKFSTNEKLSFKRPFSSFAKSPSKRRTSQGTEDAQIISNVVDKSNGDTVADCDKKIDNSDEMIDAMANILKDALVEPGAASKAWTVPGRGLNTGWPAGIASPLHNSASAR